MSQSLHGAWQELLSEYKSFKTYKPFCYVLFLAGEEGLLASAKAVRVRALFVLGKGLSLLRCIPSRVPMVSFESFVSYVASISAVK